MCYTQQIIQIWGTLTVTVRTARACCPTLTSGLSDPCPRSARPLHRGFEPWSGEV
jgi:hypothetical protein